MIQVEQKSRPILFSAPMILAIMAGTKTQTRRVMKPQPTKHQSGYWHWGKSKWIVAHDELPIERVQAPMLKDLCPFGRIGDRLWVRETWKPGLSDTHCEHTWSFTPGGFVAAFGECWGYRADMKYQCGVSIPEYYGLTWKPSIFMPRKYSRITLEIIDIKIERIESCSSENAMAEGFKDRTEFIKYFYKLSPQFLTINPWCWALSFRRVAN